MQYRAIVSFDAGGELKFKKDDIVSAPEELIKQWKEEKLIKGFDPEKEAAKARLDADDVEPAMPMT